MLLTLALLAAGLLSSGSVLFAQLVLAGCILAVLARKLPALRPGSSLSTAVDTLVLCWLLLELTAARFSVYPPNASRYVQVVSGGVSLYFCGRLLLTDNVRRRILLSVVGLVACLVAGLNLVGFVFQYRRWLGLALGGLSDFKYCFPLLGGHGEGTGLLLLFLPWGGIGLACARTRSGRLASLALLGIVLTSIALSFSRGAYLGALVFLVVGTAASVWWRLLRPRVGFLLSLTVIVAAGVAFWANTTHNRAVSPAAGESQSHARSTAGRLRIWREGVEIAKDRPWLGTGGYNVPIVAPLYATPDADRPLGGLSTSSFNSVLQLWQESGAVGLGIVLAALACFLGGCWTGARNAYLGSTDRLWLVWSAAAVLGLAAHDLVFVSALACPSVLSVLCLLVASAANLWPQAAPVQPRHRTATVRMAASLAVLGTLICLVQHSRAWRAESSFSLAVNRALESRWDDAAAAAGDAAAEDPGDAAYAIASGLFLERSAERTSGGRRSELIESASRAYANATRLCPTDGDAFHSYGRLLEILCHRKEAGRALVAAVRLAPGDAIYRISLGEWYQASGQEEAATTEYTAALVLSPAAADSLFFRDLTERSPALAQAAFFQASRTLAEEVAKSASPIALAKAAGLELHSGDDDGARVHLAKALARLPNLRSAWVNLAETARTGRHGDAEAWVNLAETARTSRHGDAELCLKRALFLNPFDVVARAKVCELDAKSGQNARLYESCSNAAATPVADHAIAFKLRYRVPRFVSDDVIPAGTLEYCDRHIEWCRICSWLESASRSLGRRMPPSVAPRCARTNAEMAIGVPESATPRSKAGEPPGQAKDGRCEGL